MVTPMAMVRVNVEGVGVDSNHGPVVVLKDAESERALPIWIGHAEATSIQMKLDGHEYGRPLTHDLMHNIMIDLEAQLIRVEIAELKSETYFATLVVKTDVSELRIDARPSDSVALALRFDAEILVEESLFRTGGPSQDQPAPESDEPEAGQPASGTDSAERKRDELRRRLRKIDPSDFGSFRLGQ
jgi:uncharacterized protein